MHRQGEQLAHRVDHRHDAHVHIAAPGLQGGVAGDLGQAVGHGHHKAGNAQRRHLAQQRPIRGHVGLAQGEQRFRPGEKPYHPRGADRLTEDGGQRRALYAHVEAKDEDGVQNQVDHGPQGHRHHAHAAEALGVDEAVHAQAHHHKGGAQQIDVQIIPGEGPGGVAGAEQI